MQFANEKVLRTTQDNVLENGSGCLSRRTVDVRPSSGDKFGVR